MSAVSILRQVRISSLSTGPTISLEGYSRYLAQLGEKRPRASKSTWSRVSYAKKRPGLADSPYEHSTSTQTTCILASTCPCFAPTIRPIMPRLTCRQSDQSGSRPLRHSRYYATGSATAPAEFKSFRICVTALIKLAT
jgi:hypothetical protein